MSELRIMGRSGDDRVAWDASVPAQVANAKEKFDAALRRGCMAFVVSPDGGQGRRITAFEPEVERVIIVPQMAGGSR